ncbi:MAG: hypothetical protein JNM52_03945 [Betaproteobacteria bacterium]|nr:hypothetical protein [Betaproteobacteria bacterium]
MILSEGEELTPDRVEICGGCVPAARENYANSAFIPLKDWRNPSEHELRILAAGEEPKPVDDAEFVAIVKLPPHLGDQFAFMREAIQKHNKQTVVDNLFQHPRYRRALFATQRYWHEIGAAERLRMLGHFSRPPGITLPEPSTSVGEHGKYVGLHIDSWHTGTVAERPSGYPTRFCYNLGPEDRQFQFINLSIRRIRELSPGFGSNDPNEFCTDFLLRHGDYPVVKVRVKPGEAYIAPTEIMIHDGSTVGKHYFDASFTFLGCFRPDVVHRLHDIQAKRAA